MSTSQYLLRSTKETRPCSKGGGPECFKGQEGRTRRSGKEEESTSGESHCDEGRENKFENWDRQVQEGKSDRQESGGTRFSWSCCCVQEGGAVAVGVFFFFLRTAKDRRKGGFFLKGTLWWFVEKTKRERSLV